MKRKQLIPALLALGIPSGLLNDFPRLPPDIKGLLVYGSQARRDAVPGSDLDLLALVEGFRPTTQAGDVNVSYYTQVQLSTGIGTLFGAHLKRDAIIIWDTGQQLTEAVDAMGEVDTDRLLERAWQMSQLFTSAERDLPKYLPGLLRQARYLLRSCLYARAIADRDPCFSVRELASRNHDPRLAQLLASRQPSDATVADYEACLSRLQALVGQFPRSEHGSLEATIVNEWGQPGDVRSMAFMALGVTGQGSDYAEVEKILL